MNISAVVTHMTPNSCCPESEEHVAKILVCLSHSSVGHEIEVPSHLLHHF